MRLAGWSLPWPLITVAGMVIRQFTVAMVGNPASDRGNGARMSAEVLRMLQQKGTRHGFDVLDLTGVSFDDSLDKAREYRASYDFLVVVGGDGMVALGANAVGASGIPLGIVAIGSGNDFARGLRLPVNRLDTSVEGIVSAMLHGSHLDVDMGHVTSIADLADTVPSASSEQHGLVTVPQQCINRYYAGMLACGLDASINDRANHSRLRNGSMRYLLAVLMELRHLRQYGYHVRFTLADGSVEERDIISPMLTVANSRHVGGGLEVSPYSRFSDGLLDVVWLERMPSAREVVQAIAKVHAGRLLSCRMFGWQRVRDVEISHNPDGAALPILMADGEYVGRCPVKVTAQDCALRVLVPPAVVECEHAYTDDAVQRLIMRDGRDPITGKFL